MVINFFQITGAIGLTLIIIGVLIKEKTRKMRDLFYIIGGLSLLTYSIYLKNFIFITLQAAFTLSALYDLIKISKKKR